jgi:predicted NBD/HSP70 family sugar kinase
MSTESTTRHLRRRNRARLLRALILGGEATRAQLAGELNLSVATVANLIGDLGVEGLVSESGLLPSEGGRPTSMIGVRRDGAFFVGADVGEHGVAVTLFDLLLEPVTSTFRDISPRTATREELSNALGEAIAEVVANSPYLEKIYGVGLGLPGIVETQSEINSEGATLKTTIFAQSLKWPSIELESIYTSKDFKIFADNGAKTLATAESWFGAAKGINEGVIALVGRGVGLGIISDGRLLRGPSGSAGEWGHTKISIGGPLCNCGQHGCLESYVGGGAIARRWREAGGMPDDNEEWALKSLISNAKNGDSIAISVLTETIEILGMGLSNLVNLFNPQQIVLGGWAGLQLAEYGIDRISAVAKENSLFRPAGQFNLVPAKFGRDAIVLGAALLAVENLIQNPLANRSVRVKLGNSV